MEDLKEKTADLVDHVGDVADTWYKLTMVNLTQKATNLSSGLLALITISILGMFVIMFLGIALCWWLGNIFENRALGFAAGAGVFLLVLLIVLALRKNIVYPYIRNLIIKKIYD